MTDIEARAARLVEEVGLAQAADVAAVRPLAGGVSSDVAAVTLRDGRTVCVKFALPRLRVAADWRAPVRRNAAEYAWLRAAGAIVPGCAPALLGVSPELHGFAMEFVAGEGVGLWKAALLAGAPERGEAAAVGDALGRIHAGSTRSGFGRAPFANRDDFRALRIEPYLLFTATRHPGVASRLLALADALHASEAALVHGDVSPKNILFRDGSPVLLDAECATMGDPCFDVAFCLNHLLLKAVHRPEAAPERLRGAAELWAAYAARVDWEAPDGIEARVAALLPALLLARVDGKSPVEYLSETGRTAVRARALGLLRRGPETLGDIFRSMAGDS